MSFFSLIIKQSSVTCKDLNFHGFYGVYPRNKIRNFGKKVIHKKFHLGYVDYANLAGTYSFPLVILQRWYKTYSQTFLVTFNKLFSNKVLMQFIQKKFSFFSPCSTSSCLYFHHGILRYYSQTYLEPCHKSTTEGNGPSQILIYLTILNVSITVK